MSKCPSFVAPHAICNMVYAVSLARLLPPLHSYKLTSSVGEEGSGEYIYNIISIAYPFFVLSHRNLVAIICSSRGNNNIHIMYVTRFDRRTCGQRKSVSRLYGAGIWSYSAFVERNVVVLRTRRSESYCTEMLARIVDFVCQQS